MNPTRSDQRLAQQILNTRNNAALLEDGIFGPVSARAAERWMGPWKWWGRQSNPRWCAATVQTEATRTGVDAGAIDAFWGPQTSSAAEQLRATRNNTPLPVRADEEHAASADAAKPRVRCWYPGDAQMIQHYGSPGSGQVLLTVPYPLRLDWDLRTTVTRISCHGKVAKQIEQALQTALDIYGMDKIRQLKLDRFGGCLNVRKKRGGTTWSAHAWGAAIDFYPTGNQLRWTKDRAAFAKPEYAAWRRCWEAAGFMSLGECANFDWMHWQKNPT